MATKRENYNEYMREYMNRRYHRRRQEGIDLLGGKCVRCPATDDLEFDHKDPKKKAVDIAKRLAGLAEHLWRDELKKCQLLCITCHRKKTCKDRGFTYTADGSVHGTISSYRHCRCDQCVTAKHAYDKKANAQRKVKKMLQSKQAEGPKLPPPW